MSHELGGTVCHWYPIISWSIVIWSAVWCPALFNSAVFFGLVSAWILVVLFSASEPWVLGLWHWILLNRPMQPLEHGNSSRNMPGNQRWHLCQHSVVFLWQCDHRIFPGRSIFNLCRDSPLQDVGSGKGTRKRCVPARSMMIWEPEINDRPCSQHDLFGTMPFQASKDLWWGLICLMLCAPFVRFCQILSAKTGQKTTYEASAPVSKPWCFHCEVYILARKDLFHPTMLGGRFSSIIQPFQKAKWS